MGWRDLFRKRPSEPPPAPPAPEPIAPPAPPPPAAPALLPVDAEIERGDDAPDPEVLDDDDEDDEEREPLPPRAPDQPIQRDAALEAELRAAPDDTSLHLVYADWLQARGEPLGRLIVFEHELDMADDARTYRRLRRSIAALHAAYRDELLGPLEAVARHARLGFTRALALATVPRRQALDEALGHPAYNLLETLHVPKSTVARVRRSVEELGRDITVTARPLDPALATDTVIAMLSVATVNGQRYAQVMITDGLPVLDGSHESLLRLTVGGRRFSDGGGMPLSEEYFEDDPPRSCWHPIGASDTELTCELWFHDQGGEDDEDRTVEASYAGTATLPAAGAVRMLLRHCPAHDGLPFTASPTRSTSATLGPVLADYGDASLPEIGILSGSRLIRPEQAPQWLDIGRPYSGLSSRATGGADGTVVASFSRRLDDDPEIHAWLAFHVPPASYAHRPARDYVIDLAALSDQRAAVLASAYPGSRRTLYVLDARTGADLWHRSVPQPRRFASTWSMIEHAGALHVLDVGVVTSYDLTTGAELARWPLPTRLVTDGHYGVGAPAFHPAPGRAAWLTCVAHEHVERSVIAWADREGGHGEAAIPEGGFARDEYSFGKVAVLEDGRIVAVGDSVWLVDPAEPTPRKLAAAGRYRGRLAITRAGARWRLWSAGGPWYVEFD